MCATRRIAAAAVILLLFSRIGLSQEEKRFEGRLTVQDAKVSNLAMSADSRFVVWAFSTGSMFMLEPKPKQFVTIDAFPGHAKSISCLAFSADSKWLASGSVDGTVKVWEMAVIQRFQTLCLARKEGTPKPPYPQAKKTITAQTGGVNSLALSPDGKQLVTCGSDGSMKIWNLESTSKQPMTSTIAHKGGTYAVVYSSDGAFIASGGADKTAKIWKAQAASGLKAGTISLSAPAFVLSGHDGPVLDVAFSGDGKQLASASGVAKKSGQIIVWDASTGKEGYRLGDLIGEPVTTVCFHPKLPRLISGSKDKKIRVFDTESKKQLYSDEHAQGVIKIAIFGDGSRMASACSDEAKFWLGSPKVAQ